MTQSGRPTPVTTTGVVSWAAIRSYYPGLRINTYVRPLPKHNLIYVKNPKAACSTILLWLDRLHTGKYDVDLGDIHKHHRLPRVGDVGRRNVVQMLSGSAYRFSFVRHPLRRFESVYWDKLARANKFRPRAMASLGLSEDANLTVSFEQFLSAVELQDPLSGMDPHWRPQHVNLLHPLVSYDHIGRVENFDADLERIRKEVSLPRVPLEVRNASRHPTTASVFDGRPDLVRRVEALYAKDFELYVY